MISLSRGPWAFVALGLLLACAPAARAQSYTWNRDADDTWNLNTNWNPTVIPNGQGIGTVFGNVITANRLVSLNSNVSVGSIVFQNTSRSYNLGGPGTLTLDNGAGPAAIIASPNVSANQTVAVPISALSNLTVTNSSTSASLLISGSIALNGHNLTANGSGLISLGTITGNGNLAVAQSTETTLTSSASNFAGTIALNSAGVLSISADAQLGAASNALTFAGGTLRVTGTTPVTSNRTFDFTSGGTIDVRNTDSVSGFTIQSAITSSIGLAKTGTGILTLSGANTHGGTTSVQAGTLRVTAASVLSPNSTLSIGGASVQLNGFSQSIAALAGTNAATLDLGSTAGTTLTVGRQGLFDSQTLFTGSIIGTGNLVKTGIGTLQMGSSTGPGSTYSGTTTVRQGILEVMGGVPASSNGALGGGSLAIRLGDASFGGLDAVLFNSDKTVGGFARGLQVEAGTGYRTIGHSQSGLANNGSTITFGGPIGLDKDLQLFSKADVNGNGAKLVISGTVSGNAGLVKIGAGDASLTADNNYTGTTTVLKGQLIVSGANGAIRSSSGIEARTDFRDAAGVNLYPGEGLLLIKPAEFAIHDFQPNSNRIGDVDVTLAHGLFTYLGRTAGASSESFANLVLDRGPNVLTMTTGDTGAGTSASLAMTGGLVRNNNSALLVVATVLGNPDGQNYARVTAATAPTLLGGGGAAGSTNISIIPWAYHDPNPSSGTPTSVETFVTYGSNGLRPLLDSEFVGSLTAPGTLNNVRLTSNTVSLTQNQTINSLRYGLLANGVITMTGQTLNVNSGAILSTGDLLTFNGGQLAFGSAEGIIHTTVLGDVVINSVISGSGGLTSHVANGLTLNGSNTYTGPTTINTGGILFNSAASFGVGGDQIRFRNAISGGLTYTAAGPTTLSNAIDFGPGGIGITVSNGGTLTVNGVISGIGLSDVSGVTYSAGTGTILLRATNTYSGLSQVLNGTIGIISENNFGDPTRRLNLGSGTSGNPVLRFDAPGINLTRQVVIQGHSSINTNGNNGTISGPIVSTSSAHTLTKAGAGTLTLSGTNSYLGPTTVAGGTLQVNGLLTHSSGIAQPVTVASGGTLGGSGTVDRQVNVNNGGGLAPGASAGQLTVRILSFAASANATYDWEAESTAQDHILVTGGPLNLTGIHIDLKLHDEGLGTGVSPSQQFPLITVAGSNSITGFDPANFTVDFTDAPNWASGQYSLVLGADGGNTVVYLTGLTPVPEPAVGVLGAVGMLTVLWSRRRRVSHLVR